MLGGRNGARAVILAGGVALHAVNVFIVTTILPSVVADIGGLDLYAWNTTLFVVASIVGAALCARLLHGVGPRGAYAVAALLFAAGTTVCAAAPAMPVMLMGRLAQGLGGGFLFGLSYAMIRIVFAEPLWPRAIALTSAMWGVATLIGPAVGGVFAEMGAWRAAFWSMVPVTLAFAVLAFLMLPAGSKGEGGRRAPPLAQLALLTLAVLALSVGSLRPDPLWNAGGVAVAGLLIAALVVIDGRLGSRLLPTGSYRPTTRLGRLFGSMCLLSVAVTSTETFVPLFLQVLHGRSPLVAGYLAALMAVGWTGGSIASSGLHGGAERPVLLLGPVVSLAGMLVLAALIPGSGGPAALAAICVALTAVGAGVGMGWPHLLTGVLRAAPAGETDLTSAAITTVQLVATALGAALAGMVVNMAGLTEPGGIGGTASAALWLFLVFAAAPVLALLAARRLTQGG
ncbi:MFS transporter [Azospirillum sp. RWY-5-1]|uniref:MFS transporter n=1 Tax=Azospirillum oleiclasticum TaxID=2735135 RepID=A0ABX2TI67_9PROT|nr:MFS transporter [Azospirillum oleiclasticum]NYZ23926.1 MFS transporter [Azospirillum oleiclasticum]